MFIMKQTSIINRGQGRRDKQKEEEGKREITLVPYEEKKGGGTKIKTKRASMTWKHAYDGKGGNERPAVIYRLKLNKLEIEKVT